MVVAALVAAGGVWNTNGWQKEYWEQNTVAACCLSHPMLRCALCDAPQLMDRVAAS